MSKELSEEDTKYIKVSFRQKGSELKGSVYKGGVTSAYTKKSAGSIPTKHENILHDQPAVSTKGFGSATFRFTNNAPANPGPGSYIDPKKTASTCLRMSSDSYSKKGYGNGFISEKDRFHIDNYIPYQVPGPTAYNTTRFEDGKESSKDLMLSSERYKYKNSPAFLSKGSETSIAAATALSERPGPGHYQISRNISDSPEYKGMASFKSKDSRVQIEQSKGVPGPGQYDLDLEGIKRKLIGNPLGMAADIITTASFKKPALAKRVKVNLYDPFENSEAEDKKSPGPGSYQTSPVYKAIAVGPSSMFTIPESLDRFGKAKAIIKQEEKKPGPGQYFMQDSPPDAKASLGLYRNSSPAFKSELKRIEYLKTQRGPGPAFYCLSDKFVKGTKNANYSKEWI